MSSKQIGEPTEEINILLRRTAVPKCDITPAVKGLTLGLALGRFSAHSETFQMVPAEIDQFGISRTLGRFKSRPGSWGHETRSETATKEVRACFDSTLLLTTRFSCTDFC